MCIFAKLNHYSTSVVMRRNPFFISILMLFVATARGQRIMTWGGNMIVQREVHAVCQ